MLLYLSWVLATTALFVPFVFLPAFARDHGATKAAAAALVSAIGGASILGRMVMGPIGDRLGVLSLFKLTVFMMGASYVIWLLSPPYIAPVDFAVLLGVAYGSRIAAVPGVLIDYFGPRNVGTVLGVFFAASGLSALLGAPARRHSGRSHRRLSRGHPLCAGDRASRICRDRVASSPCSAGDR